MKKRIKTTMHATPQSKSALDGELPHASANTSVRPLRRKVAPLQQLKQLGRAFLRALLVSRPGEESGSVEANLRRSEARIRTIIDLEPECVKIVSGEGRLLDMNPAGLAILEAGSLVEAQQRPLIEFVAPEYRAAFGDLHNRVMRGESGILQLEMIGLKGRRRQLETRAVPLRDDNGKVQNLLAITRDVTEHALSAQRSAEELRILELIARAAPLADVLDALCRSVERQCEQGASCSILLLDADGVHLRHGAAPSLPKRTVRAIDGTAIGPSAGSSGTAAYLGKQVIVTDIANDPLWRDSREVALRDGLRACWSIPVFSDSGKVLATFAIYYRYVRAPTEAELRLIERAASLASIRITREKNERALRESEAKYRGLIEQASDGIFITDKKGIYQLANSRACELLGFAQSEMIGMHGRMTHLEGDWETYVGRLQSIAEGKVLRYERMMKRKEGSAFPVEVSAKKLGDDSVQFIFRDITEHKQAEETLRESEAQYRGLIEQASDGIFVSDAQGNLLLANSRWCELLGYEKDQVAGINAKQTYLEEEREVHAKRLEHVRAGQTLRFERIVKRSDGSTFPAEISLKMLDNGCVQGIFHDITERREQESKIARLSRIQAVLSGINSAIVRMRDRQELFTEACRIAVEHGRFNIAWIAVLDHANGKLMPVAQAGLSVDFDAGGSASDRSLGLVPAGTAEVALREKRPAYDNDIESTLGEISAEFGAVSMRVRRVAIGMGAKSVIVLPLFVERQTFGVVTLYAPERNFFDDAEVKLLTELAGDISFGLEFIAKEEKADYLAYYDALSGLPNRSLFFDRLTHQLGSAARDGLDVALVIMDIDRFRLVNDTLGRQAGDALIGTVAQRIKDTFRDQDTVARVGANSFAVAVSGTWQAADAARVLKSHTHQLFGQPFLLGKEELRMSASAGVAVFPGDGDSPEALFGNAEAALKKAKAGGERLLFYNPGMNARVADSLRLENKLRRALDNGELVLWYQPKVSVRTREILGFEALMRWRDPESTLMVPPAQFIPLMEQTGLILDAGSWAMSQVARDCRTWSASGMKLPRVAVNVSPIQLRQKDFVATVIEAAHKTEEAGSMLDLEITESVIMDNVEAIIPLLQSVRNLGVEIAVDDFGTGYSSLAYIARLPIQDLKIDRSFVVGMTQSEDSLSIVRSVVSLAHSLRLNVVAEGVETEEQAALLLQLGCDQMQGYLVSRPVAPDQVPALLSLDNGLGRK